MSDSPEDARKFMEEKINTKFGQKRTEVVVDPSGHFDYSIVKISDDKVMGMASGEAMFLSDLPPDKSAYLTFHRTVGKLVGSAILPEYIGLNIGIPSETDPEKASHYWNSLSIESKKFQAMITGRSFNFRGEAREPYVGGVSAVGTALNSFCLTPESISDGDRVLVSKTAGIEAATVLAHLMPEYLESKLGQYNAKMAGKLFFKTSTIQEAQEAIKFGLGKNGITGMKSAGETGFMGAVEEFCTAGGFGVELDYSQIPVYDEVKEISEIFDLNPFRTASMGAMIMTAPESVSEDFIKVLVGNGIDVVDVGKVSRNSNAVKVSGGEIARESGRSFYDSLPDFRRKSGA